MENFIKSLEEIMTDDKHQVDPETHILVESEEVNNLISMACELLIAENGGVNYSQMTKLRNAGYRVYPGEKDGFVTVFLFSALLFGIIHIKICFSVQIEIYTTKVFKTFF